MYFFAYCMVLMLFFLNFFYFYLFFYFFMVEKPKADTSIDENEIQNTSQGRMRNYITYALSLLHVFLFLGFFFF